VEEGNEEEGHLLGWKLGAAMYDVGRQKKQVGDHGRRLLRGSHRLQHPAPRPPAREVLHLVASCHLLEKIFCLSPCSAERRRTHRSELQHCYCSLSLAPLSGGHGAHPARNPQTSLQMRCGMWTHANQRFWPSTHRMKLLLRPGDREKGKGKSRLGLWRG
jgi:hypothetical protein